MPRSSRGNAYLLVVIDTLTKWVEMFALPRATAQNVAKKLVEEVFPRRGLPVSIISDNGKQFASQILKEICAAYGIKQKFTSVFSPSSNPCERAIQSIKTQINLKLGTNQRKWDKDLHLIAFGLRTVKSEATGFTPAFLETGREFRTPIDVVLPSQVNGSGDPKIWAVTIKNRLRDAIALAHENLREQSDTLKLRHDASHKDQSFAKGDLVLRRAHFLSKKVDHFSSKLALKWNGPYEIVEVLSPLTYRLKDVETNKIISGTHHVSELKPYYIH